MTTLGMKCRCGAEASIACPTVADILPAHETLAQAGWGFDTRGNVQCPSCSSRPVEDLTPEGVQLVIPGAERRLPAAQRQGELF